MRSSIVAAFLAAAGGCAVGPALGQTANSSPSAQAEAEAAGRPLIGAPAPRFVLKTIDGESIDLGGLYGKKAVYLKFWATWCIPCRRQMPHFEHVFETAGADLAVIAINVGMNDSVDDVRKFREEYGLGMPIAIDDGRLAKAFNLQVTPEHVVIGRDGRVEYIGQLADPRLDTALLDARTTTATPVSRKDGKVQPIARYGVGDRLSDIAATTLDGDVFHARDPGDRRPTALVFFSPWCETYLVGTRPEVAAGCRQAREQLASSTTAMPGVRWLGVASGLWADEDAVRDYRVKYSTNIPLTLDESGSWFRAFDVVSVPTVLVADADGRLVRRVDGFDPSWPDELRKLLKKK
jgi:peroxiredoxin